MTSRCREYLTTKNVSADITICADQYQLDKWLNASENSAIYMESGAQFYRELLYFDGMVLHSSAIEWEGKAYLFSGPSGMGKSTHTRLWQSIYPDARVFNDDKPALRRLDDRWFAYGTPWCGKDGININMKVPIAGICFLRRGKDNAIRRLSPLEASVQVISQTTRRFKSEERLDLLLSHVDKLVREIPVYELYCTPTADAARLSSETMRRGAEEVFL